MEPPFSKRDFHVEQIETIKRRTGYCFKNERHLQDALTHSSFPGDRNNERLEFLGDALLELLVSEMLYRCFPKTREGTLSRWRALLVNTRTLANIARKLNLGALLTIGPSEALSGGRDKESILAATLEAFLGAVYLDGGHSAASAIADRLFSDAIHHFSQKDPAKDPKSFLQEYLQSQGLPLPEYRMIARSGAAHHPTFHILCHLPVELHGISSGEGRAGSKRQAEQAAARDFLNQLNSQLI